VIQQQQKQFLDIFCDSMQHFSQAMDQLEAREAVLKNQTRRLVTWVMTALAVVLLGIAGQIWFFASNMIQVTQSINELTQNMGYTQGVLHGMSKRVEDMEMSVQQVPVMMGMMQAFAIKMPEITQEMREMNVSMLGFEQSLAQLDTSLIGMGEDMRNTNLQVQLISNHTSQFARLSAP
jgi:cell division protein FtsL